MKSIFQEEIEGLHMEKLWLILGVKPAVTFMSNVEQRKQRSQNKR